MIGSGWVPGPHIEKLVVRRIWNVGAILACVLILMSCTQAAPPPPNSEPTDAPLVDDAGEASATPPPTATPTLTPTPTVVPTATPDPAVTLQDFDLNAANLELRDFPIGSGSLQKTWRANSNDPTDEEFELLLDQWGWIATSGRTVSGDVPFPQIQNTFTRVRLFESVDGARQSLQHAIKFAEASRRYWTDTVSAESDLHIVAEGEIGEINAGEFGEQSVSFRYTLTIEEIVNTQSIDIFFRHRNVVGHVNVHGTDSLDNLELARTVAEVLDNQITAEFADPTGPTIIPTPTPTPSVTATATPQPAATNPPVFNPDGITEGNLTLTETVAIEGVVTGEVNLESGVRLDLYGTVGADLILQDGAIVNLHGVVGGDVINNGGTLSVYGIIGGELHRNGGESDIASGAIVNGVEY